LTAACDEARRGEERRVETEFGDRDLTITRLTKAKKEEKTY
jgi:hypothetical protein